MKTIKRKIQEIYNPKNAFGNLKLIELLEIERDRIESGNVCNRCDGTGTVEQVCPQCDGEGII